MNKFNNLYHNKFLMIIRIQIKINFSLIKNKIPLKVNIVFKLQQVKRKYRVMIN